MKTQKPKKQMSLCLEGTKECEKFNELPLGAVIDGALEVLFGPEKIGGRLSVAAERRWLSERAIRAVCEMIVRERFMICPLMLRQMEKAARREVPAGAVTLEVRAPAGESGIVLTKNQAWRLEVYAKDSGETLAETLGRFIDFATMPDGDLAKPAALAEIDAAMGELSRGDSRS